MTPYPDPERDAEAQTSPHHCLGLIENVPVGLYRTTPDGRMLDASTSLVTILGFSDLPSLLACDVGTLYADPEARAHVLEELDAKETVLGLETRLRRVNGEMIWVRLSTRAVRGADGQVAYYDGALEDITERKRAEDALRESEERFLQSQKMEAVGKLAGGIAHDLNNLLTVMTGYSELLLTRIGADDPVRREVQEIARAGERAAALTKQLLAFSRRQVLQLKVLDLNQIVAEMDAMLRRVIGEDVDLRAVLAGDLGPVRGDQGQIEQVLMNLAVNARDAMPRGGTLTVETENVYLDEIYGFRKDVVVKGHYVMLAVTDTGCGMPADVQARVFEPFFTTKEVGKGTGLGLSMVYGFLEQSGGTATLSSELGQGTTVRLYFPRVDAPAPLPRREAEVAGASPPGGTERILVVEDDPDVRTTACVSLRSLGYQVVEAENASAALELLRQDQRIDLLFTDVTLPGGVYGPDLAQRARDLRPALKVLFTSGFSETTVIHRGMLDGTLPLISKPYAIAELARRLRAIFKPG